MIKRNVALEARLIDDLLDLSSISAGKIRLKLGPVDMHRLARVVGEMVAEDVQAKGHRLTLELAAAEPLVEADDARMQQVLWNLVRNAVKFTPDGGEIRVTTRSEGGDFVLVCRDDGIERGHPAMGAFPGVE